MVTDLILSLHSISKHYGKTVAVNDLTLELHKGEFLTILGESGAGKSTVLKIVAGIISPDAGIVNFLGIDITHLPPHKRPFAMVFQSYALFPHMTVKENLAFALKRMKRFSNKQTDQKVDEIAELLNMEGLQRRMPNQLSGGQQQRVALGRALLKVLNNELGVDKALLLMDEPLSSLDKNLRQSMQVEIKKLQQQFGLTVLYVTHEQTEALSMSDRVALIRNGKLVQVDEPSCLYEKPTSRYVANFFVLSNFLVGRLSNSNNTTFILADGTSLHVPPSDRRAGESVEILIHPEKLSFKPLTNAKANELQVRVAGCFYQGSQLVFRVETQAGQEFFSRQLNLSDQHVPSVGDNATLYWKVEDTVVLTN